jgi:hypothetical protein
MKVLVPAVSDTASRGAVWRDHPGQGTSSGVYCSDLGSQGSGHRRHANQHPLDPRVLLAAGVNGRINEPLAVDDR